MSVSKIFLKEAGAACPSCNQPVAFEDLKNTGEIQCKSCGKSMPCFNFQKSFRRVDPDKSKIKPAASVRIYKNETGKILEKTWLTKKSFPLIALGSIWCGYVGFALYKSFYANLMAGKILSSPSMLFFVPVVILGALLLYRILQELLNKTAIEFNLLKVKVETIPLSFSRLKEYPFSSIANFSVESKIEGGKNRKPIITHAIYVHLRNGKSEKICPAADLDEALYIEWLLESHLGIADNTRLDKVLA